MEEQLQIFPEIKVVRVPKVVTAICECLGGVAHFLGRETLASHGDHLPSWLPEADPRPAANEVVN